MSQYAHGGVLAHNLFGEVVGVFVQRAHDHDAAELLAAELWRDRERRLAESLDAVGDGGLVGERATEDERPVPKDDDLVVGVRVCLEELLRHGHDVKFRLLRESLADRAGRPGVRLRLTEIDRMECSGTSRRHSRLACTVVVALIPKPGTRHQVTVVRSAKVVAKTPPLTLGSRSARKGESRGGPESSRETFRGVLALSPSSKVRLPSELMKSDEWLSPKNGKVKPMASEVVSSSPSVTRSPRGERNAAELVRDTS